jgi:hypothetical protein
LALKAIPLISLMRPKALLILNSLFGTVKIVRQKKGRNRLSFKYKKHKRESDGVQFLNSIRTLIPWKKRNSKRR